MRRTQLYLEQDLWVALHALAQREGTTVSHLVRQAARERYLGKFDERSSAMQSFVGIGKDRPEYSDSAAYVRSMRRGSRTEKLTKR